MARLGEALEEELMEVIAERLHVLLREGLHDANSMAADLARSVNRWLDDEDDEDLWP